MRISATLVVSVALLVPLGAIGARQSPQAPAVFRSGTNFVSVDVYPRLNDAIVDDLVAADFQLKEDGKPQTIDSVELIRFDRAPLEFDRRDPNTVDESWRLAADPRHRLFIVYFDVYHSTRLAAYNARTPVAMFLEETLGERDLIALSTPDTPPVALTFARSLDPVRAFLARDWGGAEGPRSPDELVIEQCATTGVDDSINAHYRAERALARWRMDRVIGNLRAMVTRLREIRDGRKNVLLVSEGWRDPGKMPQLMPSARIGRCEHEFNRLDAVDLTFQTKYLIDDAERGGVSFYPINAAGLITFAKPLSDRTSTGGTTSAEMRSARTMAPTENLRALSLQTGGSEVVDTNNLRGGLKRITSELSAYYLLGYYSTNTNFDGKYRKIDVRVRRPRVEVTARRGYLAPTTGMFKAATISGPPIITPPASAVPLIGGPSTFVVNAGAASARVADLTFRRTDRIRIEWPRLSTLDRMEVRLLDRADRPLPVALMITEPDSTPPVLAIDLPLASFADGTYIVELTVGQGAGVHKSTVAIRVTR